MIPPIVITLYKRYKSKKIYILYNEFAYNIIIEQTEINS